VLGVGGFPLEADMLLRKGTVGLNITWAGQLALAEMRKEGYCLAPALPGFLCQALGVTLTGPGTGSLWHGGHALIYTTGNKTQSSPPPGCCLCHGSW
jgi:hypothetical protein